VGTRAGSPIRQKLIVEGATRCAGLLVVAVALATPKGRLSTQGFVRGIAGPAWQQTYIERCN